MIALSGQHSTVKPIFLLSMMFLFDVFKKLEGITFTDPRALEPPPVQFHSFSCIFTARNEVGARLYFHRHL